MSVSQRQLGSHKLPAELTDAELLSTMLGPSTALSCEWLTTTHDGLRAIGLLSPTELSQHGFKGGAVERPHRMVARALSGYSEVRKTHGDRPNDFLVISNRAFDEVRNALPGKAVEFAGKDGTYEIYVVNRSDVDALLSFTP